MNTTLVSDSNMRQEGRQQTTKKNILLKQQQAPTVYLHATPEWDLPLKKSDNEIVNAGREYGRNILEQKFNRDWTYVAGKEYVSDRSSPIYNSKYKNAALNLANDKTKAEYLAGLTSGVKFVDSVRSNMEEYSPEIAAAQAQILSWEQATANYPFAVATLELARKDLPVAVGLYAALRKGELDEVKETNSSLIKNNARARQSNSVYEFLNNSDYKYLVDDADVRKKFIEDIQEEVDKIKNTEQLGFLPPEINETFKKEAINALTRIINLNEHYDYYSLKRDAGIRDAMKNY